MNFIDKNLDKYFLTNDNIDIIIKNNNNISNNNISNNNISNNNISNGICNEKKDNKKYLNNSLKVDNLFWMFYTKIYNLSFDDIDSRYTKEKAIKIEYIEKLRKIKNKLKEKKIKLTQIENELLNESNITIITIFALSILHNINLMYINNNKYFEVINNDEKEIILILYRENKYELLDDNNEKNIEFYRNNYLYINNIEKPLKSITSYSKDELINMCIKLSLKNINNKNSKKELYEKILEKIF